MSELALFVALLALGVSIAAHVRLSHHERRGHRYTFSFRVPAGPAEQDSSARGASAP